MTPAAAGTRKDLLAVRLAAATAVRRCGLGRALVPTEAGHRRHVRGDGSSVVARDDVPWHSGRTRRGLFDRVGDLAPDDLAHRVLDLGIRELGLEVGVVGVGGAGLNRLTSDPRAESDPAWSPNGRRLLFSAFQGGYDVWVTNADGSGQTKLTNAPGQDFQATWAPDGTKILFHTNRDGPDDSEYEHEVRMGVSDPDVRPKAELNEGGGRRSDRG